MARQPYLRSFRIVASAGLQGEVEELLRAEGYEFEPEPFSPFCRRLTNEPVPLGSSLAAFFGYIYIQDRSSMLPPLALSPPPKTAVLDMCASPGSKTGFLAQLVGWNGFVLANEPNPTRLSSLRANMRICNLVQVGTTSYPGQDLRLEDSTWGSILLDPPCSGWGTAAKNPAALKIWQGDKISTLTALQQKLLRKAAALLAPGGRLVYSTCTTNYDEDEAQTRFAEEELGLVRVPLSPFAGFSFEERPGGAGSLLVNAKNSAAQGFYISLMRKPGQQTPHAFTASKSLPGQLIPLQDLASPIFNTGQLPPGKAGIFGEKIRFLPDAASALLPAIFSWQGAYLGKGKNGRLQPDPRLRITLPSPEACPESPRIILEEVSEVRAILSGQSRIFSQSTPGAALWWRKLPLGSVRLKNGRVTAYFH